jgi:FkbM family methyltransferase
MAAIATTRKIIRTLGLKRVALAALNAYARARPNHTCVRDNIRYAVDLTEVIDRAIWLHGWEPSTIALLRRLVRRGDIVIEVGANIGAHTLMLADLAGPEGTVYAYEPTAYAQRKLRANLALNPHLKERIVIRTELVTNHGLATPIRTIKSSFPVTTQGRPDEQISAAAVALDNESFREDGIPGSRYFLKIDVDGYDYKVLEGATTLLAQRKPLILIELYEGALTRQGDSVEKIFTLLTGLGYHAFHEDGTPLRSAQEVVQMTGMQASINAVFTTDDAGIAL